MIRPLVIVSLITLACTVNYCSSANIVDSGNFFDRLNPIRSIVGAQSYDNARLNAFTLPSRVIQGVSNIALAPWKGNDFSSRGGRLPNMGNLFRGVPVIGSLMSRPSSSSGASGNFGPMAPVEYARPPGSGSGSASGSSSSSGSSSISAPDQYGGRSIGASVASSSSGSLQNSFNNPNLSLRPMPGSQSSPVGLPSYPSSSTSNPSSAQLPSLSLGPISASDSTRAPTSTSSTSPRLSIDPSVASALQSFGFNLNNFNVNGAPSGSSPSSIASASNRPSGSAQASAGGLTASASTSSGSSGSSPFGLGSFLSSSSTPGLGQASNFLSNLFSFPLNG